MNASLDGSWDEAYDGAPRKGKAETMRRIMPTHGYAHAFMGNYRLTSHLPEKDDNGEWVIEFTL